MHRLHDKPCCVYQIFVGMGTEHCVGPAPGFADRIEKGL
jgi:hypothetical protein